MQVDPRAAGSQIVVVTPDGGGLKLDPGRQVVARVLEVGEGGAARISLAGQSLSVQSDVQLAVGDRVNLTVTRADTGGVRFSLDADGASAGGARGGAGSAIVGELARAGVPVTPQVAAAVSRVVDQLGGGSSAQAAAGLAGRGLPVTAQLAGRVAAAVDLAGQLGPALANLARLSPDVAAALPSGTPTAAALRGLLSPGLSSAELAVARIVQSAQAGAAGGPITVPIASSAGRPAVIANYVASQLATVASLDALASQNTLLGTTSLLQARGQSGGTLAGQGASAAGAGITAQALEGAVRGQAAALAAGTAASATLLGPGGRPGATPLQPGIVPGTPGSAASAAATLAAPPARAAATASAATGSAAAAQQGTAPRVAQAVADLAAQVARLAVSIAPGQGIVAEAAQAAGRGTNAAEVAQQQGRAGAAAAQGVGGGSSSGDGAPLLQSIREFLATAPSPSETARMARALAGADPGAARAAIQSLPESQSLQLAGRLLDLAAGATGTAGASIDAARLAQLRLGVHHAIEDLGRALVPPGGGDLAALRRALEHVAANDPRPAVQQEAARLLQAADGQQLVSRTMQGADPGFVYFQVPLPDGRGAEVLVRREPGRRALSFDEFDIAFLLDTQALGTLMIHLDAHPGGVRADVKTDRPELEEFLLVQANALLEPLSREARRPVTVTTGTFDELPPTSLLDVPELGLVPGMNEFYA